MFTKWLKSDLNLKNDEQKHTARIERANKQNRQTNKNVIIICFIQRIKASHAQNKTEGPITVNRHWSQTESILVNFDYPCHSEQK